MVSLASCRIGAVSAGGTNKGKKKEKKKRQKIANVIVAYVLC